MELSGIERRIKATGIERLNAMQRAVGAAEARHLVLLAPTGSGKTVAFAIAMLKSLPEVKADEPLQRVLAVVIAPSRELVMQIYEVVRRLASPPYKVTALYGGSSFEAERRNIAGAVPAIVVATPGRLLDHLQRGTLQVDSAVSVTIDEYDKTLELGFQDELRRILKRLTAAKYMTLTSATEPESLPAQVDGEDTETLDFRVADSPRSRTAVVSVPSAARDKLDTLAALVSDPRTGVCMVFVNHRESAERTVNGLVARGIPATLYHGGLEQHDREIAVAKLRAGVARVLVATDLAARGLDIDAGVDSVVHYHLPVNEAAYTHRNGRTARAGASGTVYVITGPEEDVPEYVVTDREWVPRADKEAAPGTRQEMLYINAGKEQKVSRGDVAGFVMKVCGVPSDKVGVITIGRTYSLVAVAADAVDAVLAGARSSKLKGHRVKITLC